MNFQHWIYQTAIGQRWPLLIPISISSNFLIINMHCVGCSFQWIHLTNPTMHYTNIQIMQHFVTFVHFCYKSVHCGIWDWCIVRFVQGIYCQHMVDVDINLAILCYFDMISSEHVSKFPTDIFCWFIHKFNTFTHLINNGGPSICLLVWKLNRGEYLDSDLSHPANKWLCNGSLFETKLKMK